MDDRQRYRQISAIFRRVRLTRRGSFRPTIRLPTASTISNVRRITGQANCVTRWTPTGGGHGASAGRRRRTKGGSLFVLLRTGQFGVRLGHGVSRRVLAVFNVTAKQFIKKMALEGGQHTRSRGVTIADSDRLTEGQRITTRLR